MSKTELEGAENINNTLSKLVKDDPHSKSKLGRHEVYENGLQAPSVKAFGLRTACRPKENEDCNIEYEEKKMGVNEKDEKATTKRSDTTGKNASIAICACRKEKNHSPNHIDFRSIPDDVQLKLTTYLSDDDLYEFRFLNKIFNRGYYEQRVVSRESREFNYQRAIKLACKGRVFKNVEYFLLDHKKKFETFPRAHHFPKLKFVDFCSGGIYIVRNPNIRKLRMGSKNISLRNGVMDEKVFPNLEELILNLEELILTEYVHIYFVLGSFRKLREIEVEGWYQDWWHDITKNKYPLLEKVTFHRYYFRTCYALEEEKWDAELQKLRSQGVKIYEK